MDERGERSLSAADRLDYLVEAWGDDVVVAAHQLAVLRAALDDEGMRLAVGILAWLIEEGGEGLSSSDLEWRLKAGEGGIEATCKVLASLHWLSPVCWVCTPEAPSCGNCGRGLSHDEPCSDDSPWNGWAPTVRFYIPGPTSPAVCYVCQAPATCVGAYEGAAVEQGACDEHCGHGCEDGSCRPVDAPAGT